MSNTHPTNTPEQDRNELHDAIFELVEVNVKNEETGEELYAIAPGKLVDFIAAREERLVAEAEKRGAAFAVMVVDQMHLGDARMDGETDKFYKGVKNTIRDKFKQVTGTDPAPNYPVKVSDAQLTPETKPEEIG